MNWGSPGAARAFDDGLGVRRVENDGWDRTVEVLEVSPGLAAHDEFESALRTRVLRMSETAVEGVARVHHVERDGASLRVVSEHVDGLRLPDFLTEAIKGNVPLPQPAALALAGRILRIVSALHESPAGFHGAVTPAHVVITRSGEVVLTDAVFGPAIESLQRNREQLWREFRLALPTSASLPRFDQRGDVTQLGATVLAVALGRPLRASEYPRSINEAVIAATLAARPGETGTSTSALRNWLQDALHLHPRASFATALDAESAYEKVLGAAAAQRGGAEALESTVRRIFGAGPESQKAVELASSWLQPSVQAPPGRVAPLEVPVQPAFVPPPQREAPRALGAKLRSVFPLFRTS